MLRARIAIAASALGLGLATSSGSAAEGPDYSLAALGRLTCTEINDKINEGMAAGSAEAAYSSAQLVIRRICFRYDPKAYVALLQKAVAGGHQAARRDLAYAIALGEGAPQSYATAGELLAGVVPTPADEAYRNASPDKQKYTLGYGVALSRLATREVNDLPRRWWNEEHRLLIDVAVQTLGEAHRITVRHQDGAESHNPDEAREAEKVAREATEDSLHRALKKIPPPDKTQLIGMEFLVPVQLTIPSSTSKRLPTAAEVDQYLPR